MGNITHGSDKQIGSCKAASKYVFGMLPWPSMMECGKQEVLREYPGRSWQQTELRLLLLLPEQQQMISHVSHISAKSEQTRRKCFDQLFTFLKRTETTSTEGRKLFAKLTKFFFLFMPFPQTSSNATLQHTSKEYVNRNTAGESKGRNLKLIYWSLRSYSKRVSLPTLSNQDRELHTGAGLSGSSCLSDDSREGKDC